MQFLLLVFFTLYACTLPTFQHLLLFKMISKSIFTMIYLHQCLSRNQHKDSIMILDCNNVICMVKAMID